jgi:hypothetical protein
VKVFNNITAYFLAEGGRPKGAKDRIALPVAGDDARAKSVVLALVDEQTVVQELVGHDSEANEFSVHPRWPGSPGKGGSGVTGNLTLRSRGSFMRKRGLHLEPNAAAGWLEVCQAGQNRRL